MSTCHISIYVYLKKQVFCTEDKMPPKPTECSLDTFTWEINGSSFKKEKKKGCPSKSISHGVLWIERKTLLCLRSCQELIEAPGYHANSSLLLGRLSQSASWVIFEVTGLCTPMWCRWAHPHSEPSRSAFIRPCEWPHSSPSPHLVTLRLHRGPRTNFSLFALHDGPCTTHLSHASLLFCSMRRLKLQGSSLNQWRLT